MKSYALMLAGLLLWNSATAQNWTLDHCIEHMWESNPRLKMARISSRQAKADIVAGALDFLPSLSLNWNNRLGTVGISGELTLFQGFSKQFALQSAMKGYDISLLETLGLEQDITVQTIEAYFMYAQSIQQLDYARSGYEASISEREKAALMVNGGTQPVSSLLQVEAQLASDRSALVEAECNLRSRAMDLCRLLDIPYSRSFEIDAEYLSDSLSAPPLYQQKDIEHYINNSPEYLRSVAVVQLRKLELKRDAASLSPKVSVVSEFGGNKQMWNKFADNHGICISLPITGRWNSAAHLHKSRLEVQKAELESYITLREVESGIEQALIEAEGCYGKALAAEGNVTALGESLRISRLKFEQGLITASDYITAKSQYEKARSAFLKAKWQYLFQVKIIDYYLSSNNAAYNSFRKEKENSSGRMPEC